jgi:hypothetical protein
MQRACLGLARRSLLSLAENAAYRRAKKRAIRVAVDYWTGKETMLAFR